MPSAALFVHRHFRRSELFSSRSLGAQPIRPHVLWSGHSVRYDERLEHARQWAVRDDQGSLLLQVGRQLCSEQPAPCDVCLAMKSAGAYAPHRRAVICSIADAGTPFLKQIVSRTILSLMRSQ